ncbi:MAG: DsrE family protein [Gammaproteobacteria bacterium]|nr:DsrE family protein [Gammaproteobacteria bacterium]
MKKLISVLILMSVVFFGGTHASDHSDKQNIVIHLSNYTNDLHSVNMALKIGHLLSKSGESVTLFLDLEGVRLVDKNQPQDLTWGNGDSVMSLYNQFITAGGKVLVCPHCAKAAGVSDIRDGAKLANSDSLLKVMVDADKILDY